MGLTLRALTVASVLGVAAAPLGAQEAVRAVRLVADLTTPDGAAVVQVDYEIEGGMPGDPLSASMLNFGRAAIGDLRAGASPVEIRDVIGAARAADLRLEPGVTAGTTRVRATYRVAHPVTDAGARLRGHVPVLTVDRLPVEAAPGLFSAELRVPPDWAVSEGFPTGLRATGEPGVYSVDLSVVPSVLSFRARADGAWRPALPLVLDLLAVTAIVAFSLVGWRHLRRPAA